MSSRFLVEQFNEWRKAGIDLALATVIHTEGSTYSKAGRQILIRANGQHAGLVSGGCLEGDLAEHARKVIESGQAQSVTYDMRNEADDLWGIGLGCNGLMQILLQPLSKANQWQPFAGIADALSCRTASIALLVLTTESDALSTGDFFLSNNGRDWSGARPAPADLPAADELPTALPATIQLPLDDGRCSALIWRLKPWTRLLVLGAGPDALPVVNIASALGWEITLADHRPDYFTARDFSGADAIAVVHPDKLSDELDLADYSAVIVMSHHFETDRVYLQQLAAFDHPYAGVLGPAARKTKLLNELKLGETRFGRRLSGPVGLDIGADNPETIALALLGEIQSVLAADNRTKQERKQVEQKT